MWLLCGTCEANLSNTAPRSSRVVVRTLLLFCRFLFTLGRKTRKMDLPLLYATSLSLQRASQLNVDAYSPRTIGTPLLHWQRSCSRIWMNSCWNNCSKRQGHPVEARYTPFNKLSKGATNDVAKGWCHEAVIEIKTKHGKTYYIQYMTWRNKKQVCFLSSNRTGLSAGRDIFVHRGLKGTRERLRIVGTIAQSDYTHFSMP